MHGRHQLGTERARRALGHGGEDLSRTGGVYVHPPLPRDVEHRRQGAEADPGVSADLGIEGDANGSVLIDLQTISGHSASWLKTAMLKTSRLRPDPGKGKAPEIARPFFGGAAPGGAVD